MEEVVWPVYVGRFPVTHLSSFLSAFLSVCHLSERTPVVLEMMQSFFVTSNLHDNLRMCISRLIFGLEVDVVLSSLI